jgi:hypothetical protein
MMVPVPVVDDTVSHGTGTVVFVIIFVLYIDCPAPYFSMVLVGWYSGTREAGFCCNIPTTRILGPVLQRCYWYRTF